MKKILSIGMILVLLISNSLVYADQPAPNHSTPAKKGFEEAFLNSKAVQKYKMQLRTDDFKIIEAKMGENSISSYYGLVKEYGLTVTFDDRLKHEIIQETSTKKARLGKDIAGASHLLELNTRKSNYRKIELGAFKAQLDMQLSQKKAEYAKEVYEARQKMLKLGKITDEDLQMAKNEYDRAMHSMDAYKIEFDHLKSLLDYYLDADVQIKEESLNVTKLEPLEYYLAQVENRFELYMRKKQNEMDALEIEIYEDKFNALSPVHKDRLTLLKRGVEKRAAEIEIQKNLISDEIQRGYHALADKKRSLDSFSQKVKNLEQRSENMKKLYDFGKISLHDYKSFKLKELEAQNGYKIMIMDYNNSYRDFMYGISVGPAIAF